MMKGLSDFRLPGFKTISVPASQLSTHERSAKYA